MLNLHLSWNTLNVWAEVRDTTNRVRVSNRRCFSASGSSGGVGCTEGMSRESSGRSLTSSGANAPSNSFNSAAFLGAKKERRASIHGPYGNELSCSEQYPCKIQKCVELARSPSSAARRLLPMPASPASRIQPPAPFCAAWRARSRISISRARPTKTGEITVPGLSICDNLSSGL